MYKSIIKKGKTKLDERASLVKTNLNRIKDLISNLYPTHMLSSIIFI